jgi:hypothetical protein
MYRSLFSRLDRCGSVPQSVLLSPHPLAFSPSKRGCTCNPARPAPMSGAFPSRNRDEGRGSPGLHRAQRRKVGDAPRPALRVQCLTEGGGTPSLSSVRDCHRRPRRQARGVRRRRRSKARSGPEAGHAMQLFFEQLYNMPLCGSGKTRKTVDNFLEF